MPATRFYFSTATTAPAAPISPAFDAAWASTVGADSLGSQRTKLDAAQGSKTVTKQLATVPMNFLNRQYVSVEQVASAHTISGTVSAVFHCQQNTSTNDCYLQMVLRVIAPDGTVRGTLYGGQGGTAPVSTVGAQNQEFTTSLSTGTKIWDSITLTPVAAQVGDHIVMEIGARSNSVTTSAQSAIRFYDPLVADLALTANLNVTAAPWVEFSDDIFAAAPGTESGSIGLTGAGTLTGTGTPELSRSTFYTGTGTLTTTATAIEVFGALDLSGAGTLQGSTEGAEAGTLDLAGDGTLDLSGTVGTVGVEVDGTCTVSISCSGLVSYDPDLVEPEDLEPDVDYDPATVAPPSRLRRVPDYVIHTGRADA